MSIGFKAQCHMANPSSGKQAVYTSPHWSFAHDVDVINPMDQSYRGTASTTWMDAVNFQISWYNFLTDTYCFGLTYRSIWFWTYRSIWTPPGVMVRLSHKSDEFQLLSWTEAWLLEIYDKAGTFLQIHAVNSMSFSRPSLNDSYKLISK